MTHKDYDEIYEFTVTERTQPDYRMCASISQWIHDNLEALTDDDDNVLFNKINYGYNEETLKGFGKKPVADVYIDSVEYGDDLTYTQPESVNSIVIVHVKGVSDKAYLKACELHDYIMQEFITNTNWREHSNIVRDTKITDSQLMNHPRNGWAVMVAFELRHDLY